MSDRRERGRDRGESRRGGDPPKSLFVRGLADGTRPEDLLAAFNRYGNVKDVYLPKDYYTGEPRGFAYIQYETQEEADLAYNKIEYITVNGEDLKLEWASGSRKRPEQMRARDDKGFGGRSASPRGDRDRGGDRYYRPRLRSRNRSRSRSRSPVSRSSRSRNDDRYDSGRNGSSRSGGDKRRRSSYSPSRSRSRSRSPYESRRSRGYDRSYSPVKRERDL